jgi:hypothetical protein
MEAASSAAGREVFTAVPRARFHDFGVGVVAAEAGARLELLPSATERLVELHAVEEQLGAAVVRADAHREARALRIEQRQEIDLAAVVERLRAAERGFRGAGRRLQVFGTLPLVAQRHERVLDVLERAHDAVFVAQHRPLSGRPRRSR